MPVPALRRQPVNRGPFRPDAEFGLYWMIAARLTRSNFALLHAAAEASRIGGSVRYMSSENTRRKVQLAAHLESYGRD